MYFQHISNIFVQYLLYTDSPRVELVYIVEADRSKWGPSKDR